MKYFLISLALLCAVASQSSPEPSKPVESALAVVHIYRANQFTAKLRSPAVYCNEAPLAKMQNGRYFTIKLLPGRYAFRSEDKGVGIQINAEAGKEYFVRVEMALGSFKGTQQVAEVSKEQGESELRVLKPIDRDRVIDKERVLLE
jgi:hypothetical protein